MKTFAIVVAGIAPLLSSAANLEPIYIDSDLIVDAYYDIQSNLYWSADANATGLALYEPAKTFIEGTSVGGLSGWRVPSIDELKLIYSTLNDVPVGTLDGPMNPGPFTNVQFQYYWSSTLTANNTRLLALDTRTGTFLNSYTPAGTPMYSWAVHTPVPEPAISTLLAMGLATIAAMKRRA